MEKFDKRIEKATQMSPKTKKWLANGISFFGIVITAIVTIWAYQEGLLTDAQKMANFIGQFGIWGTLIFILIQISQTVIPIIPGALTCVAGVVIYGYAWGLLWNYIGIIIGCAILFKLARRYGKAFVRLLVSDKTYNKYIGWLDEGDRYERFFIFMMIFPISPADFLCALAALTKMSFKKYMTIIVLTKPFSIFAYSYGLTKLIEFVYNLIVH